MGKALLMGELDFVSDTQPDRGSRPLSYSIDREDGRFFKWTWKKRTGGVRFVVFEKKISSLELPTQTFVEQTRKMKLFPQPEWHRLQKASEAGRRICEIRFQ